MRRAALCFILLAAALAAAPSASRADDGGWTKIYDRPAGAPSAIEMFDDHYGLAKIGSAIEQTTDGGLTWTATDKTEIGLAPGQLQGWKTTYDQNPFGFPPHGLSSLLHTIDGGATWQTVDVPGYGIFLGAWFVGADGWVLATQCFPGDPTDLAATDPPACVDHRALLHTRDDGASWRALPEPDDSVEPVIERVDKLVAYRLGNLGCRDRPVYRDGCSLSRIYRTTDGGQTWFDVSTSVAPARGSLVLRFTTALDGWVGVGESGFNIPAAYRSRLAHTVDGGRSWNYVEYPGLRSGVFDVTSISVVATTNVDEIVVYDIAAGAWRQATTEARPAFQIPMFMSRDRGYAFANTNGHATLLLTENGGATWEPVETRAGVSVTRIDPDVWWGIRDGALQRSFDGGVSWEEIPRPPEADPKAALDVQGSVGDRIWLVAGFWLWRTEDAGRTWRGIDVEPNPSYSLIDADHAWTEACWPADCRHEIRVTADGGDTWEARALPEGLSVEVFTTPLEGSGLVRDPQNGGRDRFAMTHDGGVTWETEPPIEPPPGDGFFGRILVEHTRSYGVNLDRSAPNQFHVLSTQDGGVHWVNEVDIDARLGIPRWTVTYGRIWLTFTNFGDSGGDLLGPPDRVVIYRKDIDPAPAAASVAGEAPRHHGRALLLALVAGVALVVVLGAGGFAGRRSS